MGCAIGKGSRTVLGGANTPGWFEAVIVSEWDHPVVAAVDKECTCTERGKHEVDWVAMLELDTNERVPASHHQHGKETRLRGGL